MKIIPEGFDFYASENGESKDRLILSLAGYSENLSRLPIVDGLNCGTESIFGILNKVAHSYERLSKIPKNPQSLLCILEVAGKLIKMLIQHHKPYNILELGAERGLLSFFLAAIAREFNEKNMAHCISGNLLCQEWLLLLQEYGDAAENLNMHITLPQTLSLQEDYFDFCVINNSEIFLSPNEVLNNAIRLLKIDGILVYISPDGKVAEQKITLKEKQAAYRQSAEAGVSLQEGELKILMQDAQNQLAKIEELAKEELSQLIKDLAYLEKLAIKLFASAEDINLKGRLNAAKESVLNVLYAPNEELRNLFISKAKISRL